MYYIGVDGGGTKTLGILTNANGELIKKVKLGAGNIAVLGSKLAKQLIHDLINSLVSETEIKEIAWATFAFAGLGREKEKKAVRDIIASAGIEKFSVMTDAEILYYSIFEERSGILVASGTGSVCIIKDKNILRQIGGWGYILGDEGSGFDIGKKAIRKTVAEWQAKKWPSFMTKQLLEFYNVRDTEELLSMLYSKTNPQNLISSCAKLICEQSKKNDSDALEIVKSAAKSLLKLALAAVEQIKINPPYELALTGSILDESSAVFNEFKKLAQEERIGFKVVKPDLSPEAGAVLNSIKMTSASISAEIRNNLKKIDFH